MSYSHGRRLLDADSHIMELPDFLHSHAEATLRDALPEISYAASSVDREEVTAILAAGARHPRSYADEIAALGDDLLRGPTEAKALGAFDPIDRTRALDLLGFERQLVFSTLSSTVVFDHRLDPALQYGAARAHNRGMAKFCREDARLLGVGNVPLQDPALAVRELEFAIELGLRAIWVPHRDCGGRSPGHSDFDPFWARLAESGVPFVLHVGGYALQAPAAWSLTGRPAPRDWMGGGENVRGIDMTVMHHAPERFVSAMVLHGVFERFPDLRGASIELGAGWAPALLTRLDQTAEIFGRSEPALRSLRRKPSEQIRDQFAFTPFPFEDVGALIDASSPDLFLFSSDYPHMEGGRDPLARFDRSLEGVPEDVQSKFFFENFERILGTN